MKWFKEARLTAGQAATVIGIHVSELYDLRAIREPEHRIEASAGEGTRDQRWSPADVLRLRALFCLPIPVKPSTRKAIYSAITDRHVEMLETGAQLFVYVKDPGSKSPTVKITDGRTPTKGGGLWFDLTEAVEDVLYWLHREVPADQAED